MNVKKAIIGRNSIAPYTLALLNETAKAAGRALFAHHKFGFQHTKATQVEYLTIADRWKIDEDCDMYQTVGEYEYIFFPSKPGIGLDVSGQGWEDIQQIWVDTDGNCYSTWDDVIYVIKVNKKIGGKEHKEQRARVAAHWEACEDED